MNTDTLQLRIQDPERYRRETARARREEQLRKKKRRKQRRRALLAGLLLFVAGAALLVLYGLRQLEAPPPISHLEGGGQTAFQQGEGAALPVETEANPALEEGWELVLVNKDNPLPAGWLPTLAEVQNGAEVDERIAAPLKKLLEAAEEGGIPLYLNSAYRSRQEQEEVLWEKIWELMDQGRSMEEAKRQALSVAAQPGTSEHETGLALDIIAADRSRNEEAYRWLFDHAWEYGFALRYPAGKTEITGIEYEPWHYRYVGEGPAREMWEQGLCLEEYLERKAG